MTRLPFLNDFTQVLCRSHGLVMTDGIQQFLQLSALSGEKMDIN